MKRILQVSALLSLMTLGFPGMAAADYWARFDRPWTNLERTKAIHFCRMQPKLDPTIPAFIDTLMGKQIERCMYALGWVGVED